MFLDTAKEDVLTIETVPNDIGKAAYPAWFLSLSKFLLYIKNRYRIIFQWKSAYQMTLRGYKTTDKGFLLERLQ
jgi:hypothetical protein